MHFEELLKFKVLYKVLLNTSKKSLVSQATSNNSITSLGTKVNIIDDTHNDGSDTDKTNNNTDDDRSLSDKPSLSKKQEHSDSNPATIEVQADLMRTMFSYFEENNIDISTLEARSITQATASATAAIH